MLGTVAEIQLSRLFSGMKKSEWEHNGNGKLLARNARIQLNCSLLYFTNHTAAVMQDRLVTSLKKTTLSALSFQLYQEKKKSRER